MSTQVQIRKGNTIQTAAFTGAIAELTVDTDKKTLVVHDGVTAGGIPLAKESSLSANAIFSQAAFNAANSAATLSAATDLTQNNSITAAFLAANSAATLSDAIDATQNNSITAAFTQANTAVLNAGNASIYANGAFLAANTAATLSAATDATQNTNITNAQNTADAAFLAANSAATLSAATDATQNTNIISVTNAATAAFLAANSADTLSAATDLTQNNSITAAFTRANNSISANAGGTITGDLVVTGNLTISGQTTYSNTVQLLVGDNLITLNAELPTSVTPVENAGIEINRGNTFANSSLLWIEASGKWQANSGSSTGAYFLADEAVVTAAFLAANSAATLSAATDLTQNTNITSVTNTAAAAFLAANSAATLSDATDLTQNNSIAAAFTRANSALALTGGTIAGNVTANSVIANNSIYSPIYYSTGGLSNLILSDIGLVAISVAGQTYQFGGSGLESNQGMFGGTFGGNRLSLNNETNLISNRYDTVKIQTGTDGTTVNDFVFANNSLTVPGGITANGFTAGGINVVPTLTSSFSTANAAFLEANSAATLSAATDLTQNNSITAAFNQANTDFTNVSVAAGTYGNTTHYGVVTVAANGRVTAVQTFVMQDPSALAFSIALG